MDSLIDKVRTYHADCRVRTAGPEDTLLITPTSADNQLLGSESLSACTTVSKETKSNIIDKVRQSGTGDGRPSEQEALRIFSAQSPAKPTSFLNHNNYLPGGASLIDHAAAYVADHRDWSTIKPHLDKLSSSRLPPKPLENGQYRELTLGEGSPANWKLANGWLRAKQSHHEATAVVPLFAADTESITVEMDFPRAGSAWESLTTYIQLTDHEEEQSITFKAARPGMPAVGLPTRFLFGTDDWLLMIRLPITIKEALGRQYFQLDLTTKLTPEMMEIFASMRTAVGVGIVEDYVQFSDILFAIWGTRLFEKIADPIELQHLMRVAGINTVQSSLFHLNLWCFGTVLPKKRASMGDNIWCVPYAQLPHGLRTYLCADIKQPVDIAQLLTIIFTIHLFPDMVVVSTYSDLDSPTALIRWVTNSLVKGMMTGWGEMEVTSGGHWLSAPTERQWTPCKSRSSVLAALPIPRSERYDTLRFDPGWPSMTCGGPRYVQQVRLQFSILRPLLTLVDNVTWPILHVDDYKLIRHGRTEQDLLVPDYNIPCSRKGLVSHSLFEDTLNCPPQDINRQVVMPLVTGNRTLRGIFQEYARCQPADACQFLHQVEENRPLLIGIVGVHGARKIVHDLRSSNAILGTPIEHDAGWVDPFHVEASRQRKLNKQLDHVNRVKSVLTQKAELYAQQLQRVEHAISSSSKPNPIVVYHAIAPSDSKRRYLGTIASGPPSPKRRVIEKEEHPMTPPEDTWQRTIRYQSPPSKSTTSTSQRHIFSVDDDEVAMPPPTTSISAKSKRKRKKKPAIAELTLF
jgi:hypothetical protein